MKQFRMYVKICSLNMLKCQDLETIDVPDVCGKLNMRNAIWTPFIDKFQPTIKCPFSKVITIF